MCICQGKTETKENVCKCSHMEVTMVKESYNPKTGKLVRFWECDTDCDCQRTWEVNYVQTREEIVGR